MADKAFYRALGLVNTRDMFARAMADGYAIPAYNFNKWVGDVEYWNYDPSEFVYCGGVTFGPFFEGSAYVTRFDGYTNHFGLFWGSADYIDISSTDDSLLYAGIFTDGGPGVLKSIDGGRSWDSLSVIYEFLSLNPFHSNIFFVTADGQLFRTINNGNSFGIVDTQYVYGSRFYYDNDGMHIYRVVDRKLIVSNNLGQQFSWIEKYSSASKIFFTVDYSVSGNIYLATGKNIFNSSDYGDNFSLYKSLDRKIVGIYKKPNSEKLYAATKYKIYEITPDTIQVIKSLPIPDEILNLYPLMVGNKWVYNYIIVPDDPLQEGDSGIYVREVLKDTVMVNGKHYSKIYDETLDIWGQIVFERIDSLSGKVFRYFEDTSLVDDEYMIHDLLAEVGDTIYASRYFYYEEVFTVVLPKDIFSKWGVTKPKNVYQEYTLGMFSYSLTEELGLDSIYYIFDFGYGRTELKGCIINGIVYGDTAVVSVEDEKETVVSRFMLEQNYPNPFNPTTKIRFTISDLRFTILKVYDVLGNEVATLVNEELPAGEYEVEFSASSNSSFRLVRNLASGIYFYQLKAGSFIQTRKMIHLK